MTGYREPALYDRVKFSAAFCRNTGQHTGWTPFARGVVVALEYPVRRTASYAIATVAWDDGKRTTVNLANLVGENMQEGD